MDNKLDKQTRADIETAKMLEDKTLEYGIVAYLSSAPYEHIQEVRSLIKTQYFYHDVPRHIYQIICWFNDKGENVTPMLIMPEVMKRNKIPVTSFTELLSYQNTFLNYIDVLKHIDVLTDYAKRRDLWLQGQKLIKEGTCVGAEVEKVAEEVKSGIDDIVYGNEQGGSTSMQELLMDIQHIVDDNAVGKKLDLCIPTGFSFIDKQDGLSKGDLDIIAATSSMGKALLMDEPILTPNGWVKNKDLKVGDEVCSIDGQPSQVLGIFPQGIKDIYKVTFGDGRSIECSGDHLWEVHSTSCKSMHNEGKVVSTLDIMEHLKRYKTNAPYIPTFSGKYGTKRDFLIHPYIIGVLLGDGCLTKGATFAKCEDDYEIVAKCRMLAPDIELKDYHHPDRTTTHSFVTPRGAINPYLEELKRLGLYNHTAEQKFIPDEYKDTDYESRLELLRGLLDTDGYVDDKGAIEYTSVSKQLSLDVQYLCRSIGLKASIKQGKSAFYGKPCKDRFRVCIMGKGANSNVFSLKRKKERAKGRGRNEMYIRSVEYVGRKECQCIGVSHPRALFIAHDFIVTHNTAMAVSLAINVITQGYDIAFFSTEMKPIQISARILSHYTRLYSSTILKKQMTEDQMAKFNEGVTNVYDAASHLFFHEKNTSNYNEICQSIRKLHSQHHIKGVIVDFIQRLSGRDKGENDNSFYARVSQKLKDIAMELDIWVVLLSQLNRNNDSSKDAKDDTRYIPTPDRLRGSGEIFEAADNVWFIYRPDYYNKEYGKNIKYPDPYSNVNPEGTAMIIVAKGRNVGTGSFIVGFDADTTHFYELEKTPTICLTAEQAKNGLEVAMGKDNSKDSGDMPF